MLFVYRCVLRHVWYVAILLSLSIFASFAMAFVGDITSAYSFLGVAFVTVMLLNRAIILLVTGVIEERGQSEQ